MKYGKYILASAVVLVFLATGQAAQADKIVEKTIISGQDLENVKKVNFSAFDTNKDGRLSMEEVGTKLFYIFDTDGNEVIDNIEFTRKNVMTIVPMEKETFTFVDTDEDGSVDETSYTRETFYRESGLLRFDESKDGLSPDDFANSSFASIDSNDDKVIDLEEWKGEYIASRRPPVAEQERYN